MSTNNFKFENILAVIPDFSFDNRCLDEECSHFEEDLDGGEPKCEHCDNYYEYDTEGYKMYVEELQGQLSEIGFEDSSGTDDDSSYSGDYVSSFVFGDDYNSYKTINVILRSGYYEGINLDYEIDDYYDGCFTKSKIAKMDKQIASKIVKLEKIIRKNCTELLKVGQFSNGEALYKLK